MKRHQCLIAALKEYAIMLDVCKRGGTDSQTQVQVDEIKAKMKQTDAEFRMLTQLCQIEVTGRLVVNGMSIPD